MTEISATSPIQIKEAGLPGESATSSARRLRHFIGTPITKGMSDDQVLDAPLSVFNELVEAAGVPVQYADVRAASSLDDGNITLSGEQTIGINVSSGDPGIDVVDGDRVLLTYQDAAAENGLWIVVDGGTWTRPTDFDVAGEAVTGATVQVLEGSQTGLWRLTTQGTITIDTTAQTWRAFSLRNAEKVSFSAGGAGATPQSVGERIRASTVHLMDYVPKSQWAAIEAGSSAFDATGAMAKAAATRKRIILPAGTVRLNYTDIHSGFSLEGEAREASIVRPFSLTEQMLWADSGDVSAFVTDIHMAHFTLYGTVEANGFAEDFHLAYMAGARDALFEHLSFMGFRGDGLLLDGALPGSDFGDPSNFRHNFNVVVRDCVFDGITRNNRNAISVIDCDGLSIVDCWFERCGRNGNPSYVGGAFDPMNPAAGPGMPGVIDIEPNGFAPYVIRNIQIVRPRFRDNGGNVGQIAIFIPAEVTADPTGIVVTGGDSDGYVGLGSDFYMRTNRTVSATSANMVVRVESFRGTNGKIPIRIAGVKGAVFSDVVFEDYTGDVTIGGTAAEDTCRDILLSGARLARCGSNSSIGVVIGNVAGLTLDRVTIEDAGTTGGIGILLLAGASSSYLDLFRTSVTSPSGNTSFAIINQGGAHNQGAATNRLVDCNFGGFTNDLRVGNPRGVSTLVAGTVTITAPGVTASSKIKLIRQTAGGTLGHLSVGTITAGASFVINSSSSTETSTIYYEVEPS